MEKAAAAFGRLKEYERELEVLNDLLSQTLWRRAKRGKWYDRRALILTNYIVRTGEKEMVLLQALDGLKIGLIDDDTGGGMFLSFSLTYD